MEFSRQEYWSRLPFPHLGELPDPETELTSPESSALAGIFFTPVQPGKLRYTNRRLHFTCIRFSNYKYTLLNMQPFKNIPVCFRQMSGQVSRGSAGEDQADERAGVARLSWQVRLNHHHHQHQLVLTFLHSSSLGKSHIFHLSAVWPPLSRQSHIWHFPWGSL